MLLNTEKIGNYEFKILTAKDITTGKWKAFIYFRALNHTHAEDNQWKMWVAGKDPFNTDLVFDTQDKAIEYAQDLIKEVLV